VHNIIGAGTLLLVINRIWDNQKRVAFSPLAKNIAILVDGALQFKKQRSILPCVGYTKSGAFSAKKVIMAS